MGGNLAPTSFSDIALEYFERDLIICPVNKRSKRCLLPAWQLKDTYNDYEKLIDNGLYRGGFGILLGKVNNIICADIDTKDKKIQDQINSILPPSPVMKSGSKHKTLNRFYKYSGESKLSFYSNKEKVLEILADGQFTVLPPTAHEDGHRYEWHGQSILDFEIDDLPILPPSTIDKLSQIFTNTGGALSSGGRNDRLKTAVIGMATNDCMPVIEIITEIIKRDHEWHAAPLFADPKENAGCNNIELNAMRFVQSNLKSISTKLPQPVKTIRPIKIIDKKKKNSYKIYKFPHLTGIGQTIFKDIYKSSPKPRTQLTEAVTLSLISLCVGNRFAYEGTYANLYNMMICPSGGGKDAPMKYISDVLHKSGRGYFIGESAPASDTAILMNLTDNKNQRIDIIDEASKLFMAMSDSGSSTWQNMANIYQELFTATGSIYNGKSAFKYKNKNNPDGVLGRCYNPYINLLCAMTISDFNNHFTTNLMEKGLGGRFLYFADDEEKRTSKTYKGEKLYNSMSVAFIKKWLPDVEDTDGISMLSNIVKPKEIIVENRDRARDIILDVERQCLNKISSDNHMRSILVRHHVIIKKLAMIKAVEANPFAEFDEIAITLNDIDWAINWGDSYLKNLEVFLGDNLHDSKLQRAEQAMIDYIKHRNLTEPATKKYLSSCRTLKKFGFDGAARNRLLRDLIEQGVILESTDGFIHKDFVEK